MQRSGIRGISARIALPAAVLAMLLVAFFGVFQFFEVRDRGLETLDNYADLLGRLVVNDLHDAMLANDRPRMQRQIEIIANQGPIREVRIVDKKGNVVFSSREEALGDRLSRNEPSCDICHQGSKEGPNQTGAAAQSSIMRTAGSSRKSARSRRAR